jgi:putative phosphoesterase
MSGSTSTPTPDRRSGFRIGLVSDTHDLLRPEAEAFLRGCDHIVHAGDIIGPRILEQLATLAPLTAVRGNNDRGAWAAGLRETELVEIGGLFVYAIHDLAQLDIDPHAAGVDVVVSGHSHKPSVEVREGVLFVNPGSAGPRRFTLPISIGDLTLGERSLSVRTVELTTGQETRRSIERARNAVARHEPGASRPANSGH